MIVSEGENDEPHTELAEDAVNGVLDETLQVSVLHDEGDVVAGRYRLTSLLGRGGMGDVWRAHDETLEIEVALKLIRPQEDADDSEDRLLREARIAAKLGHPAIVRIFDFGRSELDEPFIVMELLDGIDVAVTLKTRGVMNPLMAVRIILPIVHALGAAHSKGIVHRDLKPDNIFLAKMDGDLCQPKIVDFGIAKLDRSKAMRLTRTGALIGSPMYMSPEQGRGDEVDQRTDLWSLCIVLYEMVTGHTPFQAKNSHAVLQAIRVSTPEPIPRVTPADEHLWSIIKRGLEKEPDDRWANARELGLALAEWLEAQGVTEDITGASLDVTWRGRGATFDSIAPSQGMKLEDRHSDAATIDELGPPRRRRRLLGVMAASLIVGTAGAAIILRALDVDASAPQGSAQRRPAGLATAPAAPPASQALAPVLPEPEVYPAPVASTDVNPAPAPSTKPSTSRAVRSRTRVKPKAAPPTRSTTTTTTTVRPKTTTKVRPKMKDPFQ